MNSRLDTIQAAILIEKLAIFEAELEARQAAAARYARGLAPYCLAVPTVIAGRPSPPGRSMWSSMPTATGWPPICAPTAFQARSIIRSRCTCRRLTPASHARRAAFPFRSRRRA